MWNRLTSLDWLAPEPTDGWQWTRILFVFAAFFTWYRRAFHIPELYSNAGPVAMGGMVKLTRLVIFTPSTAYAIFACLVVGWILIAHGRHTRIGAILFLICSWLLIFQEGMNIKAYDRLLGWHTMALILAPNNASGKGMGSPMARIFVILYLCNLYGMTGLGKIMTTSAWWVGTPLAYDMVHPFFGGTPIGVWTSAQPWLVAIAAWWTVIFEAAFPILIWIRSIRPWVLLFGLGLHLGLFLMMDVGPFSLTSIVVYPILLEPREFIGLKQWLHTHSWTQWWKAPWVMVKGKTPVQDA